MKQKIREVVEKLYDKRIDTLFVSDTSAVPYGYAIKEAFKTAYNKPLKVLRVDVNGLKYSIGYQPLSLFSCDRERELEKKVQETSNKLRKFKSKRLAFFDESLGFGGNPHPLRRWYSLDKERGICGRQTKEAYGIVINSTPESKNIECMEYCGVATLDREGSLYSALKMRLNDVTGRPSEDIFLFGKIIIRNLPIEDRRWLRVRGRNKKILEIISKLKSFGKEIGEEIKNKRIKQTKNESKN